MFSRVRWWLGIAGLSISVLLISGQQGQAADVLPAVTFLPMISNGIVTYQIAPEPLGGYRLFCDGHHFMTILTQNDTLNFRPHPGIDLNGWGSSWYAHPFFGSANPANLEATEVHAGTYGVGVMANGGVSQLSSNTAGEWTLRMTFSCDALAKEVRGNGRYQIHLFQPVSNTNNDLNLFRIASNFLKDVPLLGSTPGQMGHTGDMLEAHVWVDTIPFTWNPASQPSHFPTDIGTRQTIDLPGTCNHVDTAAQGYAPIAPASKPGLLLTITSLNEVKTQFGGFFDETKGQDFWEDNIGITPQIDALTPQETFAFDLNFISKAPASDGIEPCWAYEP